MNENVEGLVFSQRPLIMDSLLAQFPTIDRINIEETLAVCDGDAGRCAAILQDVLDEEAVESSSTPSLSPILRGLLDVVSQLAQLPPAAQPAASRERLMRVCDDLETNGIFVRRPVERLLDGERDAAVLTGDLDEADAVVVEQMLSLIAAGGAVPSGALSEAEQRALVLDYGTSSERSALEASLESKQADLATKAEATELLKRAVIKQRLGAEGAV